MRDEAELIKACAAGLEQDPPALLVYADLLEERAQHTRARVLRLWHSSITSEADAALEPSMRQLRQLCRALAFWHGAWLRALRFPLRLFGDLVADHDGIDVYVWPVLGTLIGEHEGL